MQKYTRLIVLLGFMGLCLALSLVFWQDVMALLIQPLAKTLWLLLRLSVLSFDQKDIWGALVLAVLLFFLYRLGQSVSTPEYQESLEQNAALKNIEFWNTFFNTPPSDVNHNQTLKSELVRLLVAVYSSDQQSFSNYEVFEALKSGVIPVPPAIYNYLLREEPAKNKRSIKTWLKALWMAPRKWVRRWTKQDLKEHNRMVDEVLTFLEMSLEVKDGNKHPAQRVD
jgi:hypothetical protein